MTVDNQHVGSILGKGGSNINQIRSASGAQVKIHEAQPGTSVRLIEVRIVPLSLHRPAQRAHAAS